MRMILFAAVLSAIALPAAALVPLAENREINDRLLAVGLANEIRKRCDEIGGRLLKGVMTLQAIHREALSQGYTREEIEAYVESDAEKARMKARGRAWLAARGAAPEDPASMCRVGRDEIEKGSAIGRLLYEK